MKINFHKKLLLSKDKQKLFVLVEANIDEKNKDIIYKEKNKLQQHGFKLLNDKVQKWFLINEYIQKKRKQVEKQLSTLNTELIFPDKYTLYEHQIRAIKLAFLHQKLLFADSMGSGKTVEAIVYYNSNEKLKNMIISIPKRISFHWKIEIEKWKRKDNIQIITHRTLHKYIDTIDKDTLLVIDECHLISSKYLDKLNLTNVENLIFISSIIPFQKEKLFYILKILMPEFFESNYHAFYHRYILNYPHYEEELYNLLQIKGTKQNIQRIELERIIMLVESDVKQIKELENKLLENDLSVKQHIINLNLSIKKQQIIDFINEILIENKNAKIIISDANVSFLYSIAQHFKTDVLSSQSSNKEKILHNFITGKQNILIASLKFIFSGFSFDDVDVIIVPSVWSNIDEYIQFENRVRRINTQKKCIIYYFVLENTLEMKRMQKLLYKISLFD
ncbi:MAG: DEAD/DEAH box helicase [Endomicrobia bacterium]|nr:DEAD/DEAH box helicase [Endomicrobiia bacterium]